MELNKEDIEDHKDEVYQFLNKLRDSGVTNMFGAGPYIEKRFGFTREESSAWLGHWMDSFSE